MSRIATTRPIKITPGWFYAIDQVTLLIEKPEQEPETRIVPAKQRFRVRTGELTHISSGFKSRARFEAGQGPKNYA